MAIPVHTALRVLAGLAGAALLAAGLTLGYIAVIAARRSEGVFLPAGYVAIACLVAGGLLLRVSLRGP
jgi:hypothetical protein